MKKFALIATAILSLGLTACQQEAAPAKPQEAAKVTSIAQDQVIATIKKEANGFSVGPMMSQRVAYVFYDMQCPHCGHLWDNAKELTNEIRFVWIPIGMLNPASVAQGATILASKNQIADMDAHEKSIAAHQGGMTASPEAKAQFEDKIKANTALIRTLGVSSVPFIVVENSQGKVVTKEGAIPAADLKAMFN